jgi:hypothetical protein
MARFCKVLAALAALLPISTVTATPTPSGGPAAATPLPPSQDPWYTAPPGFESAAPGTILRSRVAPGNLSLITANSSAAFNILYRTTDSRYLPTWAVTTLFVPKGSSGNSGKSNNALVAYQLPYDTANVDGSPSFTLYRGAAFAGGPDIPALLGKGWYVSVPDYEGPLASDTAGVISGHATIDSVRAVLSGQHGLSPQARYAMWGYSGGALASEWAAELQVQYAPEMSFAGAALGGLTPNVTNVLLAIDGTLDAGRIPSAILGLSSQFPDVQAFLLSKLKTTGPYNATTFLSARHLTLQQIDAVFGNQTITDYFVDGIADLLAPSVLQAFNRDGMMGYHGTPQMPLFVYKAIEDELSPIADTDALVARYCGVGATIQYQRNDVGGHGAEFQNGEASAFAFLVSVLEGTYTATGCSTQNVTIAINTSPEK